MFRRPGGLFWMVAAFVGAFVPVLTVSVLRVVSRDVDFAFVTDFGFGDFQASLVPVLLALLVAAIVWERAGRRVSVIGYAIVAPLAALAGLHAFFAIAYGARPSGTMDAEEVALLASIAIAAGGFAMLRAGDYPKFCALTW